MLWRRPSQTHLLHLTVVSLNPMDQTIIQCWWGCFCVLFCLISELSVGTSALHPHIFVSICIDFCYLFRKRERERERECVKCLFNTGCQCVCVCVCVHIHPCFQSIQSLPFMWMCFCVLAFGLPSNIFGKRSVRCSAQNCVTFRGGFTKNRLCHYLICILHCFSTGFLGIMQIK